MKIKKSQLLISCTALLFATNAFSQTSQKISNTLSVFYIDNNEGYKNDALNASLNPQVTDEFKKKLSSMMSKNDNYFFLMANNGQDVHQSNSVENVLQSEWLKKYLAMTSKEAEYGIERQMLRDYFSEYPVKIKKEVDFYVFLSGYSLNQITKKTDDLPTPVFMPKELPLYLFNTDIAVKLFVYTNKDTVDKLTQNKIANYFSFCETQLKVKNTTLEIIPL